MSERVFLAIPTYDGKLDMRTMSGVMAASKTRQVKVQCNKSSLLASGFNRQWIAAVESGCDWWAMLHSDIGPCPNWADILIDECVKAEASVCSAVVPIKGPDKWVSTALCHDGHPAHHVLTMDEVRQLPETFDESDVRMATGKDGILCLNTGMWVARLTEPWVRQVSFNIATWIDWTTTPPTPRCIPEDWGFSQQLHRLGLKRVATTACQLVHIGETEWCLDG